MAERLKRYTVNQLEFPTLVRNQFTPKINKHLFLFKRNQ